MTDGPTTAGYDAVVFDMDGTLVEYTGHDHRRSAAVEAFDAVGIDPTDAELDVVAESSTANAREICDDRGVDPADFYARFDPALLDRQLALLEDGGKRPYPDAVDALDRLGIGTDDGAPVAAVLSNNYQAVVEAVLDRHFPGRFHTAYGVDPGLEGRRYRKPDTRYLQQALDDLGVNPDRTVVVGDGASDVAVAAAAGMDSVHVRRHDTRPETATDPTHQTDGLTGLPAIVRGRDDD